MCGFCQSGVDFSDAEMGSQARVVSSYYRINKDQVRKTSLATRHKWIHQVIFCNLPYVLRAGLLELCKYVPPTYQYIDTYLNLDGMFAYWSSYWGEP